MNFAMDPKNSFFGLMIISLACWWHFSSGDLEVERLNGKRTLDITVIYRYKYIYTDIEYKCDEDHGCVEKWLK